MSKRFLWTIFAAVAAVAVSAFAMHAIQTERVLTDFGRIKPPNVRAVSAVSPISSEIATSANTSKSITARRPGSSLPAVKEVTTGSASVPSTFEIRDANQQALASKIVQRRAKTITPTSVPANLHLLDYNNGTPSDDRGRSTLDARCVLQNTTSAPYWWAPGFFEMGDYVKVWFTPRQCGASWSPFRIDSVEFAIGANGAGTFVFGIDIECPMTPYDSTTGPAYPLSHPDSNWYAMTFPTGGGSYWVKVNVNLDVCVNHGFFVGLRFDSWTGNPADAPTVFWDSQTTAIARGRQWICNPGCCDWRDIMYSGRINARVYGNTVDACTPVACTTTAPCVVTCQTGDIVEATETADSAWMSHDPNGGCFVTPHGFGSSSCGQWVCGRLFTYVTPAGYAERDFDWYTFTLTQRDSVRLTVVSEFPVFAAIVDTNDCVNWNFLALAYGTQNVCTTRVITGCLDPGTYAFLLTPGSFYCPAAPGADYRAKIDCFECQSCPPPANDDCANATTITCPATDVQADLACATRDCDSLSNPEVWYKFYLDPSVHSAWNVGISWCGTDPNIISIGAILYSACPCSGSFGYTGASSFNCGSPSWLPDTIYFENVPAGWWYMPVYTNLGTTAVFDLSCWEYVACTPTSANDNCASVSPFSLPATFNDDNTCATHDCDSLTLGQGETWHAFTLTQQCDVMIDYCGTDTSHFGIFYTVLFPSCPCSTIIYATATDFTSCGDGAITMRFDFLQPGTYYLPVLRSDLDGTAGPYTIHVYCAPSCTLVCPGGAIAENEPPCTADYVDATNGGCGSTPPVFSNISCGQTVCGTSGTFVWQDTLRRRDTDWYRVTLTQRSYITWSAWAEFPAALIVYDSTDCDSGRRLVSGAGFACDTVSVTTAALPPGEYWLLITPNAFEYVDCSVDYIAWASCTPCDVVCLTLDSAECAETPGPTHGDLDCNGGCFNDPSPALYQNITCGQSICGVSFMYNPTDTTISEDTDWYHFALADSQQVSVTVEAEFPVDVYVLNYDCGDIQVLADTFTVVPCVPVTVVTATALPPGDYTVMVRPEFNWYYYFDGWAPYPSQYRLTLGCPCVPAIKSTVYLNANNTLVVVRWVAPAAGAYKIFSTVSKTDPFNPGTWTLETTQTVASGTNEWTDPAGTVPYKRYVVQHICQ